MKKIFSEGTDEYGLIITSMIKQIDHHIHNTKVCNEERMRLHSIRDFISMYGTVNKIDKRALDMIMRTSFQRKDDFDETTKANTEVTE